ncbi:MAG: type II toxin-antitoxin system RelB/DinJ family antitoxin [Lachnospiraceae bacterium]|jgi:DNA-damage-inducible protein J|nr:type II toxin-antitoxin system RelB/DinJ family antitoxin [Lachnospiraceae bacterium]
MAGTTVNVSIRMDAEIKTEAEELFSELGLSLGAAVNVFVRQAVRQGGLPFKVTLGKKKDKVQAETRTDERGEYPDLETFFAKLDAG